MAAGVPTAYLSAGAAEMAKSLTLSFHFSPMMTRILSSEASAWINITPRNNGIMNRFLITAVADKPVKIIIYRCHYHRFCLLIPLPLMIVTVVAGIAEDIGVIWVKPLKPRRQLGLPFPERLFPKPSRRVCGRYPRVYRNADLYYTAAAGRGVKIWCVNLYLPARHDYG